MIYAVGVRPLQRASLEWRGVTPETLRNDYVVLLTQTVECLNGGGAVVAPPPFCVSGNRYRSNLLERYRETSMVSNIEKFRFLKLCGSGMWW